MKKIIHKVSACVAGFIIMIFVTLFFQHEDVYGQMETTSGSNGVLSPAAVKEELSRPLPKSGNVTVNFKDVDIQTVLHYLSEVSGVDIVPAPGVEGLITMRLRDKPWEVALDIVTRNYSFAYSRDDEKGIIRVMPKSSLQAEEPVTAVIPLNYIIQSTEDLKEGEEEGEVKSTDRNITQLMKAVNSVIVSQAGEQATFLPAVNAIVVTAIPARVSVIKEMLSKVDKKTPQIMLEAKVIEVTLDKNDQFGIDWNAVISATGADRPTTLPFRNDGTLNFLPGKQTNYYPATTFNGSTFTGFGDFPIVDALSAVGQRINPSSFTSSTNSSNLFTFGTLNFSQFSASLEMIAERDDTTILSSPRVTTLNNQPAVIKVISNVFLQKQQKTTDTASVVTVEFEEEPREIGVILEVTPHVNDKEEIMVNLNPRVSSTLSFTELSVSGSTNTVAMKYNSREADTQVMVKDGETIFIGGLISETKTKEDHKLPILGDLLGDIPIVGSAFKYEQDNLDITEVVFFITVYIVKDGMDTVEDTRIQARYDEYYPNKSTDKTGSSKKNEATIRKGKLKTSQKEIKIEGVSLEKEDIKKGYKPFLDFRKKKKGK